MTEIIEESYKKDLLERLRRNTIALYNSYLDKFGKEIMNFNIVCKSCNSTECVYDYHRKYFLCCKCNQKQHYSFDSGWEDRRGLNKGETGRLITWKDLVSDKDKILINLH